MTYEACSESKKEKLFTLLTEPFKPSRARLNEPRESIGAFCVRAKTWSFLDVSIWDITGQGLEQTKSLKPAVKKLLDDHNDSLAQGQKVPVTVMFDVFMIGGSEISAAPTLVVICQQKGPRLAVIDVIRGSRVLDSYHGVRLGGCSQHPRYPGVYMPQSIATGPIAAGTMLPVGSKVLCERGVRHSMGGMRVYIPQQRSGMFRKATIGGFLGLEKKHNSWVLGLTVAHAFETLEDDETSFNGYQPTIPFDFHFAKEEHRYDHCSESEGCPDVFEACLSVIYLEE